MSEDDELIDYDAIWHDRRSRRAVYRPGPDRILKESVDAPHSLVKNLVPGSQNAGLCSVAAPCKVRCAAPKV